MARTIVLVALAVPLLAAPLPPSHPAPGSSLLGETEHAGRLTAPNDFALLQRTGPDGTADPRAFHAARQQARAIRAQTASAAPGLAAARWEFLGPTNFGGRVTDLVADPIQPDTVYAATASGGVWKSRDGGLTFAPSWPDTFPQETGAIAASPDGTLYVGTGESNPGGGSLTFGGDGVYRSHDGGTTWEHVGLEASGAFGRIVVHPSDPDRIYAAATGNLFISGGQRGLYGSKDGGDSWDRLLAGSNEWTGAVDVAVDPSDPDRIFAAMWDHKREPHGRTYYGPGSGLFRSTDGGQQWERIDGVAPTSEEAGRIAVAIAPSHPARMYATVVDRYGRLDALHRSDDAGETWRPAGALARFLAADSSFAWWFGRIWVDPADADRIFVPGIALWESRDGGFTAIKHSDPYAHIATPDPAGLHPDQHAMAWDPHRPGRVWLGNDGGVYTSSAAGTLGTWTPALSQGWTQHYTVDVSEQRPQRVVSGLQDNRCQRNDAGTGMPRPDAWTRFNLCGDGLETLIHPWMENTVYGCSQYGTCDVSFDGGVTPIPMEPVRSERVGWWMPLEFGVEPFVMFAAGNRVNESRDAGLTWAAISPDLTGNPEPGLDGYPYGTVTTIGVSRSDTDVLYAGTDTGLLWKTTDRGQHWSLLSDPDLPNAWITSVAVEPADADRAFVSYSGYRAGDDSAYVLRTTDGGDRWDDITGDLPRAPVNDVIVAPDALVVATDVGVFLSYDEGTSWLAVGDGLPLATVSELRYHSPTRTVTAATFGRGVMRITLP